MKLTKEEFTTCFERCLDACNCEGCPLQNESFYDLGETSCTRFMLKQLRESFPMFNSTIDIPKIIDEAMEKKNRSVTIFISPQGTTINVYPYQETKPHWIRLPAHGTYECSECGINERYESPYCPVCGEKLAISDTFYECNKCRIFDKGLCDECTKCKDNSNFKPIDNSEVTEDEQKTPVE